MTQQKKTVQIPRDLFRPEGYSHKEALFGIPVYGGTIAERLFYANTTKMCSAPTAEEVWRLLPCGVDWFGWRPPTAVGD